MNSSTTNSIKDVGSMNWMQRANTCTALMQCQARAGISFDTKRALHLRDNLIADRMKQLELEIEPHLPDRKIKDGALKERKLIPPKRQFKADGSLSALAKEKFKEVRGGVGNWEAKYPDGTWRELPCYEPLETLEPMPLSDSTGIKNWLVGEHGWKPLLWNVSKKTGKKTSPKLYDDQGVVCPSLDSVSWPYIGKLKEYLSLLSRKNLLGKEGDGTEKPSGLLGKPRLKKEGLLTPASNSIANTHRRKHSQVVNLPSNRCLLGSEIRGCFIPRKGNVFVGYDASSLEAAIASHYTYPLDGGAFAEVILKGDWHSANAEVWGVDRSAAKTGAYAVMYGARPSRLAMSLKKSVKEGKKLFKNFWDANSSLKELKNKIEDEWKSTGSKFIIGLDGRPVYTRAEHSLLNLLFQSAGAIVMDLSLLIVASKADSIDYTSGVYNFLGKPCRRVLYMHDEALWDCPEEVSEHLLQVGIGSIKEAGKIMELNVELSADGTTGSSYAEVH